MIAAGLLLLASLYLALTGGFDLAKWLFAAALVVLSLKVLP